MKKQIKYLITIYAMIQIILGLFFFVSKLAKGVDPIDISYKIIESFSSFGFDFFKEWGVFISVFNEVTSVALLLTGVGLFFCVFIFCLRPLYFVGISMVVSSLFFYTSYISAIVIIFIFGFACRGCYCKFAIPSYIFTVVLLLLFMNDGVVGEMRVYKERKNSLIICGMKVYEDVCEDYSILPILSKNQKCRFKHDHLFNEIERYEERNEMLLRGVNIA